MVECRTKVSFKCPRDYAPLFKNSACVLTISVGQKNHESHKLHAAIDAVNKSFNSCIIMLCDTLQRHTLKIQSDKDENQLYGESLIAGDDWLTRNNLFLSKLTIETSPNKPRLGVVIVCT